MVSAGDRIPTFQVLPTEVYFRHQEMAAGVFQPHRHPWGQITYLTRGLLHLKVGEITILSMPRYAVWIPPGHEHGGWLNDGATCRRLYLSQEFSKKLPKEPCCLTVSPLLKGLLNEFARQDVAEPRTKKELAMAQVVLDQIEDSPVFHGYLPFAVSTRLQIVLSQLKVNKADKRTIGQIAVENGMTARTLERKAQRELGMGFGDWRQRLKLVQAIEILEAGTSVQDAAYQLGYATSSAFIAMFRRQSGETPERYRRSR